jgi:hypothetical protein
MSMSIGLLPNCIARGKRPPFNILSFKGNVKSFAYRTILRYEECWILGWKSLSAPAWRDFVRSAGCNEWAK